MSKQIGVTTEKGFHETDGTGFDFKIDDNGVLKVGDVVIPQKKLLWQGTERMTTGTAKEITLTNPMSSTTASLEIVISSGTGDGDHTGTAKMFVKNLVGQVWTSSGVFLPYSVNSTYGFGYPVTFGIVFDENNLNYIKFNVPVVAGTSSAQEFTGCVTIKAIYEVIE